LEKKSPPFLQQAGTSRGENSFRASLDSGFKKGKGVGCWLKCCPKIVDQ